HPSAPADRSPPQSGSIRRAGNPVVEAVGESRLGSLLGWAPGRSSRSCRSRVVNSGFGRAQEPSPSGPGSRPGATGRASPTPTIRAARVPSSRSERGPRRPFPLHSLATFLTRPWAAGGGPPPPRTAVRTPARSGPSAPADRVGPTAVAVLSRGPEGRAGGVE